MSPTTVKHILAPKGKLRAAINFGNAVLAKEIMPGSQAGGVTADLTREFAKRLDVEVEFVTFRNAGKVVEAIRDGLVDIGYVAIDPLRAQDMVYTPAYVIIEGAYVVKQASPLQANEEVDRAGTRIVAAKGSAYDLYLSRELKAAKLEYASTSQEVVNFFLTNNADVAAGVKQQLEADVKRLPGLRMLPGRFMTINQAVGIPHSHKAALPTVVAFIEEMKRSGFVAQALARHGIEGASVAP